MPNFVFKIVTNFLSRPKSEPLKEKVLATTSENKKSIQLLVDQCLDKIENGSTIQCANGLQTIRQSFKIDITAPSSCDCKGSSDTSHFIFVINIGKQLIRHRTTRKLNFLID